MCGLRLFSLFFVLPIWIACGGGSAVKSYSGSLDFSAYPWLKNKSVCIDPGHGGTGSRDEFRKGPFGVTEEAVNLRVALRLENMLKKAGVAVYMTRRTNVDVSLDDRAAMITSLRPDILVSVHHNGTIHAADGVNYTCVLVRGSRFSFPAGYDLAGYVRDELAKVIDAPALVVSDHSVFQETGARILRLTDSVCPGIIGEGGFFTNEKQAYLMTNAAYNEKEAEAYFKAISAYFKGGIPKGELYFSCPVRRGIITSSTPDIFLKASPGAAGQEIADDSVHITLDDVPITSVKYKQNVYKINYGWILYPGVHRIRFQFRNTAGHSSMVFYSSFIVEVAQGDFAYLIREGRSRLRSGNYREGLKMILSAYSMEPTGPLAGELIRDIADGFLKISMPEAAAYYRHALRLFHPDSPAVKGWQELPVVWHPVKYYGKKTAIIFGRRP